MDGGIVDLSGTVLSGNCRVAKPHLRVRPLSPRPGGTPFGDTEDKFE